MPALRRIGARIARLRGWAAHTFLRPACVTLSRRPAGGPDTDHAVP